MIDGIKMYKEVTKEEVSFLKSIIDFASKVVIETAEIIGSSEIGYYRGLKLTLRKGYALTIQGSLHKAFNNGINYNQFTFSNCIRAIELLTEEIGIDADLLKVQNVEFGVNVFEPIVSFDTIDNNLLLHKLTPFKPYVRYNQNIGFECKHQQYSLKIYDKSMQENLDDNVLRLEYKVTNMILLKSIGIKWLSDLRSKNKLEKVGNKIGSEFLHILMDNCYLMEKQDLTMKDHLFYYKARNVRYWKRLSKEYSKSTYTSHRRRFKRIVNKYSNQDLAENISNLFIENWSNILSK